MSSASLSTLSAMTIGRRDRAVIEKPPAPYPHRNGEATWMLSASSSDLKPRRMPGALKNEKLSSPGRAHSTLRSAFVSTSRPHTGKLPKTSAVDGQRTHRNGAPVPNLSQSVSQTHPALTPPPALNPAPPLPFNLISTHARPGWCWGLAWVFPTGSSNERVIATSMQPSYSCTPRITLRVTGSEPDSTTQSTSPCIPYYAPDQPSKPSLPLIRYLVSRINRRETRPL